MIQQTIKLLSLLSDKKVHSGVELGESLGVSRAAVWKLVQRLQQQYGIDIKSVNGAGYYLENGIELLDAAVITKYLNPASFGVTGPTIFVLDSVNSTNDLALQAAAKGAPNLSIWVAEHQVAGRGRRGKQWMSPMLGNIYCSLLWRLSGGAPALDGLSLVVGIAIAQTLRAIGLEALQLKWPNDIWIDGKKVGGVLIEISGDPFGECSVVIGFGINIFLSDAMISGIEQPATALSPNIPLPERNRLLGMLVNSIVQALHEHKVNGFEPFMSRWRDFDALNGRQILVHAGNETIQGKCLGITSRGALQVETAKGIEALYSGEVSVRAV